MRKPRAFGSNGFFDVRFMALGLGYWWALGHMGPWKLFAPGCYNGDFASLKNED